MSEFCNSHGDKQKFIIVEENNFNVFAYTENKVYKAILKKLIEPQREFKNMLHGVLTRSQVEKVFR